MEIFERMGKHEHEQIVFWSEPEFGYRGIIAIHDTTLGPALGGTRFMNYDSDQDAIVDALRLSRGMTYKAAVAGLNLGGGKSVIIGDNRTRNREMIFRAHGRAVESLGGRYITAEDVGTSPDDMEFVLMETEHVTGIMGRSGDPSPVTAHGVFSGIRAAAMHRWGSDDLTGRKVAVQGLGHVGYHLCQDLHEAGAELIVTDIDPARVQMVVDDFDAAAVGPDDIYAVDAEIFAPCALGAVINDDTLKVFKFEIICGAANNQLARTRHGPAVDDAGILYGPDYVVNAGGLINVYGELNNWSPERGKRKSTEIYATCLEIFELAEQEAIPTAEAADRIAIQRVRNVRHLNRSFV
jgi:leucine dehydrogenase